MYVCMCLTVCAMQNFADSRIRVKGRFVKKDEEQAAAIMSLLEVNKSKTKNLNDPPAKGGKASTAQQQMLQQDDDEE